MLASTSAEWCWCSKTKRVMCFGINVSLALALRGIMGVHHGETDRGWGVTCLTNPLKTPPRDSVHVRMPVHMQRHKYWRSMTVLWRTMRTCMHWEGTMVLLLPPDSLQKRPNYATIWHESVKASGLVTYVWTDSEWSPDSKCSNNTWQCNVECKEPHGLFKYHRKYRQLFFMPCLTPLIHLPLPLSFTIPSLFQSMLLLFAILHLSIDTASPHPPPASPPSVFLSEWPQRTDVSISDYFSALGLWAVLFLMGWDSEILKCMRSHMLAGEMDRFLSWNKSLNHQQTMDTLRLCLWAARPLETTVQLQR